MHGLDTKAGLWTETKASLNLHAMRRSIWICGLAKMPVRDPERRPVIICYTFSFLFSFGFQGEVSFLLWSLSFRPLIFLPICGLGWGLAISILLPFFSIFFLLLPPPPPPTSLLFFFFLLLLLLILSLFISFFLLLKPLKGKRLYWFDWIGKVEWFKKACAFSISGCVGSRISITTWFHVGA